MATIKYDVMGTPPVVPTDNAANVSMAVFDAFVDNVSWQLYGGELAEKTISEFTQTHYNKYYYYPNFDLREYYDLDGYILNGKATLNFYADFGEVP